jgi:hypothetical protein
VWCPPASLHASRRVDVVLVTVVVPVAVIVVG